MAVYIDYEKIPGNATAEGFAGHIKALSLHFGIGRGISMEPGCMSNREATRPSLSEITFTKAADVATSLLLKESVTGSKGKKVIIKFTQTGENEVEPFMDYELEDCLVSGYSISADGDGHPIETITLSFAKIWVRYIDRDQTNTNQSPAHAGYDLTTAKPF